MFQIIVGILSIFCLGLSMLFLLGTDKIDYATYLLLASYYFKSFIKPV